MRPSAGIIPSPSAQIWCFLYHHLIFKKKTKNTCFHTCLLPSPGGNFQSQDLPFISSAGCALHREAVLSICCMYKASRPHETWRLMWSRHMLFILISSIMLPYKTPKKVNLHQHSIFLSGYLYWINFLTLEIRNGIWGQKIHSFHLRYEIMTDISYLDHLLNLLSCEPCPSDCLQMFVILASCSAL